MDSSTTKHGLIEDIIYYRLAIISRPWLRQSLRVKMAALILLVGLMPVTLIAAFGHLAGQRTIEQGRMTQTNERAGGLAAELDFYFKESRTALFAIAGNTLWADSDSETEGVQHRRERRRVINQLEKGANVGIEQLWFAPAGGEVLYPLLGDTPAVTFAENRVAAELRRTAAGLKANEVARSRPYVSADSGRWVIASSVRLFDPSGEELGSLFLERGVDQIQSILKRTAGRDGEVAFVIDDSDRIILSSDQPIDHRAKELIASRHENTALPTAETARTASGSGAALDLGGVTEVNRSPALLSLKALDDQKTAGNWRVAVAVPRNTAAEAGNTFTIVPLFIASVVIFGLLAGGFVHVNLTQPLKSLALVAGKVAGGDLDATVSIREGGEIGAVADSFNHMTRNLKSMVQAEKASKSYLESTVSRYTEFIDTVGSGDLSSRLSVDDNNDELARLGQNLNKMVESLGAVVGEMREGAEEMTTASNEIFSATSQHNATASEQAAAVEQTAATVDEVRQTAEQATERARSVAEAAQKSVDVSEGGLSAVEQTIESMTAIKVKVEDIAANTEALSEQTQQIGNIIASVNDIAEQSNLLALNASIEAARAGEQGKGFAVVAAEVRNLAEQSQQATAQVRAILDDIQKATNTVVSVTEEGTKGVDTGMSLANQAGETIRGLAESISESAQAAEQIVASAAQQAAGMDQIAAAMTAINEATNQTLASTRQTEKAAEGLSKLGLRFKERLSSYRA
jgi:methyl-accepting chemotaxis protein